MSEVKIKTDWKWKRLLYGYELPKKQRKNFDYIEDDGEYDATAFAKYRGQYYDISEFMVVPKSSGLGAWDGYHGDSFFSGIVIKLSSDGERYKIGMYYS